MRKIEDIYKEYNVMPMLALHQLRVASVAMQICDSLSVELDKETIIKACLFHDIANIIKFNLNYFPEQNETKGIEYWQKVKDEFIDKYGDSEHIASVKIVKELGLSDSIVHLVDIIEPEFVEYVNNGNDLMEKIGIYADNRVTPHGVVSIEERNLEAKKRYENHPHAFGDKEREFFMKNMSSIEKQIFSYSNIKPEDINDESILKYLEILKEYKI